MSIKPTLTASIPGHYKKMVLKKIASFFSILAILFGINFGSFNTANAADLTLTANDAWKDGDAGVLSAPADDDNVDVDGFVMTINSSADVGAVTDTDTNARNDAGDVLITSAVADADLTITIASLHNEGLVDIKTLDADDSTVAVTFEGAFDTNQTLNIESTEQDANDDLTVTFSGAVVSGGAITVVADGSGAGTASNVTVNFAGNVTNGADSSLNDNGGGLAKLVFNGTGAQTVTKEIEGAGAGEGTIQNSNTGNTVTFSEELGSTNELLALTHDASSTTVHTLAVDAITVTSAGTETYSAGGFKATTYNKTAGSATFDATNAGDTVNNIAGAGPADVNLSESTTLNFTIASGEASNVDAVIDGTSAGFGTLTFKNTDANAPGVYTIEDTIGATSSIAAISIGSSTVAGSIATEAAAIVAGAITVTGGDAAAEDSQLDAGANITAGSIALTPGDGDAILDITANSTIAATIDAVGSGSANAIVEITGGTGTFSSAVGGTTAVDSFTLFNGTAAAINADFNATTTTITDAATITYDAAADQTHTGAITATAANDGSIVNANTDGELTFTAALGTSTNELTEITLNDGAKTNFNAGVFAITLDIDTDGETTVFEVEGSEIGLGNAGALQIVAGSVFELGTAIGDGNTVFDTTLVSANDAGVLIAGEFTVKPSANFTSGTIVLIQGDAANVTNDEKLDILVQDTALTDFTVDDGGGTATHDIGITANAKSDATTASELSVTTNAAAGLRQAMEAVANDSAALTAFNNAMVGINGQTSTSDSDLAKQASPQTDLISGSSVAAQGVTGSVQGIMSNRMASLRSGDAYFGTGVAAGGMSAQSGFIQVFGSETDQDSTKVGSGTQAGFDASTQGVAIGFDGVSDNGMTVGVSVATANTDVDGKGTGKSSNSIDTYSASLYMDTATENGYFEGSLTFGVNENSTSRVVDVIGLSSRTLTGSYDSQSISLNLSAGMPNEVGAGYLTPFGSFTATSMDIDAYTEKSTTANDALRLKVAQDDISSMVGTVGLKFHGEMDNGGIPMISLAINNEFGDSTIDSTNTFQGGGTAFKTSTAVEELSATLGLGYSYGTDAASIEFAYEADANDDEYLSHYGSVKIVSKF